MKLKVKKIMQFIGPILIFIYIGTFFVSKGATYKESPLIEKVNLPTPHEPFYPKNLCNIKPTSELVSKKIDNFAYECMHAKHSRFLIRATEANYTDVVRNINKR